jgi:phage shock protein PspC (stress-responsive transcriptional regulator)
VREPDDRKIAGVCSGLADAMGIDVTVMRLGAVVLALITPVALIAYLVASVALPERRPDQPRVRARRVHLGSVPNPVIVIGAIVAVAAIVDDAWWLEPFPAAVALVGVGVWLIVLGREADGEPPPWPAPAAPTPTDSPTAEPWVGGPAGWPVAAPGDVSPGEAGRGVEPADAPAAEDGPDTGGTVEHPMAASPWLASVPGQSDAEGVRGTTFTGDTAVVDPTEPLASREGVGPPGELPPPASPWWSGRPAEQPAASPAPVRQRPPRSRLGSVSVSVLLMGAGVLWLLASLDIVEISGMDALAIGLLAVGVGLVIASWWGRAHALIPVGVVLIGLLVVGETLDVPLDAGTGDRTVVVDTARQLARDHELFAGELTIDLSDAPLTRSRPSKVEASVGMGELRVIVPRDAAVDVTATSRAGEIVSPGGPGANQSGTGLDETFTLDGDGPRLELDLSVGLGSVEVVRG